MTDPLRIVATPLDVIDRRSGEEKIRELLAEYQPDVIVVGMPIGLSGREGPAAHAAREFGAEIAGITDIPIEFVDERFTTVSADSALQEAGLDARKRRTRVDKVAASIILRQYLEADGRRAPM